MSVQHDFVAALLAVNQNARPITPPGLSAWNGADPAKRFAVYRNNVMVSLIDALADSFPVTRALVGEEFFSGMARLFVQQHPPTSPVMAFYGEEFAAFIAGFEPAACLPYLPDMARLEYRYVLAYHAADADPIPVAALQALLADEARLTRVRFRLHPSLAVLSSPYAVVSLWGAHQALDGVSDAAVDDKVLSTLEIGQPESVLLCRVGLAVELSVIPHAAAVFIRGLQAGRGLAAVAEEAASSADEFSLADSLEMLIRLQLITGMDDGC